MWLFHEHGDVLSLIIYVNPTQVHAVTSGGESKQEQEDAEEDDGGLSARVSALSLGEEGEEKARSLPRRLYLVQRDTAVDVRAGAAAASAAENSIIAAGGHDDDPWATVGGLERAVQEVVGCVEQASWCGVVWCQVQSNVMYVMKPFVHSSSAHTQTRSQSRFGVTTGAGGSPDVCAVRAEAHPRRAAGRPQWQRQDDAAEVGRCLYVKIHMG